MIQFPHCWLLLLQTSYRSALHTYRKRTMNSIQSMLNFYLPISLVPRQSLPKILDDVAVEQWRATDRITLAIPIVEVSTYFESKLLLDVIVFEQRLIMSIENPLPTKESAFTVPGAKVVPMPQPDDMAIKWKLNALFSNFGKQRWYSLFNWVIFVDVLDLLAIKYAWIWLQLKQCMGPA